MPMIDADTHVDECEDTWKKLEGTTLREVHSSDDCDAAR